MFFLDFNIGNWLSEGLEKVPGAARTVFNTICYTLDTVIYKLIINLYNLFEALCTSKLLSGTEFDELTKRIGFILGMIMIFNVIFSFIKILIDPDALSNKETGAAAIVKKCIIVIVMLGMSSFAFDSLYKVQNVVIKNHVISRLLLPYSVDTDNFGAVLSEEVLLNFYVLNENTKGDVLYDHCSNYITEMQNQIIQHNNFELGYNCLNETIVLTIEGENEIDDQEHFIIDFNGILSVIVGCAIVWILFRYCISVGVRVVQLTVLQIISPMAIISYLSPKKETMFQKWGKVYFATYIDVFIRIAIINFVIYLCAVILDNWESGLSIFASSVGITENTDPYTKGFICIVMILALLTFAKKAPDLIKELLPASASKLGFGMGLKDVVGLEKGMKTIAGAGTGAAVGLIGGLAGGKGLSRLTGALGGAIGGVFRGGHAGFGAKGLGSAITSARSNQAKANLARAQMIASGGHHSVGNIMKDAAGIMTQSAVLTAHKEEIEREIARRKQSTEGIRQRSSDVKRRNGSLGQVNKYRDEIKARAEKQIADRKYRNMNVAGRTAADNAAINKRTIEALQQQAGKLDVESTEYADLMDKINRQQELYNANMDIAVREYVNTSNDGVISAKQSEMQTVINMIDGITGDTATWDTIETVNDIATAQLSDGTNELTRIDEELARFDDRSIRPLQDQVTDLDNRIREAKLNERNNR